jgi:hypothetical protein
MQFTSKEDIEGPIDRVFAMITDFDSFERAAMRRGAEVARTDKLRLPPQSPGCAGMAWKARFKLRGRDRVFTLNLVSLEVPNGYRVDFTVSGLDGDLAIDLVSMSRNRTRMTVAMELRPRTLAARLLVQSLKLARTNLSKRFALRVADYAKQLEDRLRAA